MKLLISVDILMIIFERCVQQMFCHLFWTSKAQFSHIELLTDLYLVISRYRSVFGKCPKRHTYGFIERIKMQAKLSTIPTRRPISMATITTVKKVTNHTIASKCLKKCKK